MKVFSPLLVLSLSAAIALCGCSKSAKKKDSPETMPASKVEQPEKIEIRADEDNKEGLQEGTPLGDAVQQAMHDHQKTVEEVKVDHSDSEMAPKEDANANEDAHLPDVHLNDTPAEKALGWLKNGNIRYTKNLLRNDGQSAKDRKRLSPGQKPHTIIVSCSDSRVPPEVIFDQKLGEIFVIRTAGEALDHQALASIEYAVAHLGTQLIMVMGHTSCGAVSAALDTLNGGDAGSEHLNHLVRDIHPRIRHFSGLPRSEDIEKEVAANTEGVARDLIARSKIISHQVNLGQLQIKTAIYHLDSGKVDFK